MNKLILNKLPNVYNLLWIIFFISLPWSIKIVSVTLGMLLFLNIAQYFLSSEKKINKDPAGVLLIIIFILILIRFSFDDFEESLFVLEKRLSFLIIPLIFILSQFQLNKKTKEIFLFFFSGSCIMLIIFLFINNYIIYIESKGQMEHIWQYSYFTSAVNFHPVYFTIYLNFVFFFLLFYLMEKRDSLSPFLILLFLISIVFAVFTIFFIQARISIISLLITGIILLFRFLFIRYKYVSLVIILPLIIIATITILQSIKIKTSFNRFDEISKDFEERVYQWAGAWNVATDYLIFGAGPVKSKGYLDYEYLKLGHDLAIERKYNSHNQYLHIFMAHGLIGLIVFFGILGYAFYLSFKKGGSNLLLAFLIIMSCFFLTENVLSSQKGIVFFTSIYCLLIYDRKIL